MFSCSKNESGVSAPCFSQAALGEAGLLGSPAINLSNCPPVKPLSLLHISAGVEAFRAFRASSIFFNGTWSLSLRPNNTEAKSRSPTFTLMPILTSNKVSTLLHSGVIHSVIFVCSAVLNGSRRGLIVVAITFKNCEHR